MRLTRFDGVNDGVDGIDDEVDDEVDVFKFIRHLPYVSFYIQERMAIVE